MLQLKRHCHYHMIDARHVMLSLFQGAALIIAGGFVCPLKQHRGIAEIVAVPSLRPFPDILLTLRKCSRSEISMSGHLPEDAAIHF